MKLWHNPLAKLLVWLLVGIVPAQPVLALDCACSCHAHEVACCELNEQLTSDAHDEDSHDCHHHSHTAEAADADLATPIDHDCVATDTDYGFGIRPCHCPGDCDCQSQHEAKEAVVKSAEEDCDRVIATDLLGPIPGQIPDLIFTSVTSLRPNSAAKLTALELCALLCRFIS